MKAYLFRHLDYIKNRIDGERVSLFLDYDGTLTPIVSRPEKAFLSSQMKGLIRRLCAVYKVTIVSGREIGDLKKRVDIPECLYVGNHGLEIGGKGVSFMVKEAVEARGALARLLTEINEAVTEGGIRGAVLEDKKLTTSFHYRLLDKRDVETFLSLVRTRIKPHIEKGLFRIVEGKKVIEVRPNVYWDKGKAVEWLLMRKEFKGSLPLYVGDDETDRDAFRAIKGHGISIAVGPLLPDSDYYLRNQGEVKSLLKWLKERVIHCMPSLWPGVEAPASGRETEKKGSSTPSTS